MLTADEVAERTGVTVRTIRYYQSEGLLPAPVRHGREVRYNDEHLARLELITRLQERGLRLNAIADVVRQSDQGGATAADWLGLSESLTKPWTDERPVLLTGAELTARLGEGITVEDLVRTGVVERRDDTSPLVFLVPSQGILDSALALAEVGIDLDTGARLRALIQDRLRSLATDLVARFTDEVSLTLLADAGPADLARLLEQLRPLTRRTVDQLFALEMERAQRHLLESVDPERI